MSINLFKAHIAFYTSTADVDNRLLKYYTDECKTTQLDRAHAEFIFIENWWKQQDYTMRYGAHADVIKPRGVMLGVSSIWSGSNEEFKVTELIEDYKEMFLSDYDNDNAWWGRGEAPLEGYALEYVWVRYAPCTMKVADSNVIRLGAYRRHLDLNIDVAVSNNFYLGEADGIPF